VRHVWIDTKTFVDVKIEGTPRRMGDKMRTVWVMQRDLCSVQGLMVPFILETAVDGFKSFDGLRIPTVVQTGTATTGAAPDRMVIGRVVVNPPIDQRAVENPAAPHTRKAPGYTPRRKSALSPTGSVSPAETPLAAESRDAASPPKSPRCAPPRSRWSRSR
jgi:hypothetical protein